MIAQAILVGIVKIEIKILFFLDLGRFQEICQCLLNTSSPICALMLQIYGAFAFEHIF